MEEQEKKDVEVFEDCETCGGRFSVTKGEISFGVDPYDSEIRGNDTEIWQCESCSYNSMMEI